MPEFPAQPYELPVFFQQLVNDYFKVYTVTEEDKLKTQQYKSNALRKQALQEFGDFSEYLRSLNIQMTIATADEFNIQRIAQMTQKTNQFNLTTRRYTDVDIRRFLQNGWRIWCLSVADRFGDSGITGCLMLNGTEIDTFLLSCRILGKGIELAFVKKILKMLKEIGMKEISASFIPTAKNKQVATFYEKCGFSVISEDEGIKCYNLLLDDVDTRIEDYYQIKVK